MLCIFLQKQSDYFSNDPRTSITKNSVIEMYRILIQVRVYDYILVRVRVHDICTRYLQQN